MHVTRMLVGLASCLGALVANWQGAGADGAPQPPPGMGMVYGTFFDTITNRPVGYGNVLLLGERQGTIADSNGYFEMSVSPGPHRVAVLAIGFEAETLSVRVAVGERVDCGVRYTWAQSKLRPARRPDPRILERIERSAEWRAFRVKPEIPTGMTQHPDSVHAVGLHPILTEGRQADARWKADLIGLLSKQDSYDPDTVFHAVKLCEFFPIIGLRIRGEAGVTNMLICFGCDQFGIQSPGLPGVGGDFDLERPGFVRLVRTLFPTDSLVQSLR